MPEERPGETAGAGAAPATAPLEDLLVVDLSRYLPGPLVARLLGDLGARVIKVEEPKLGDPVRHAPPLKEGTSSLAALLLSGHESLALDLRQDVARRCLETLLDRADVLLESFRPGKLAELGLAPEELRRRFPRLVICSVSGWGQTGPDVGRAGHDLTYQAIAGGLASGSGMPALQIADVVGAWSAATSVLAAIHRRGADGSRRRRANETQGCWIDQALLDAAGHAAITAWAAEADGPKADGQPLMLSGAIPCYDLYPTKDGGRLALATLEPKFWQRFCRAVERGDLIPRQYDSSAEVRREVEGVAASRTREEWLAFLADHDIPADPVLTPAEAREHPQVQARELVTDGADGLPRLGFPALLDGARPRGGEEMPELGGDTDGIVEEFGLAAGLSARKRRAGGVGRRASVKRWALGVAGKVLSKKK